MARQINKLTARQVATANAPGLLGDGAGLYLQVGPTGGKSWLFRYMLAGKAKSMGLGAAHTVSLAEAREKARNARKMLLDGKDPVLVKREHLALVRESQANQKTFADCAATYVSAHRAGWKNSKHGDQWTYTLEEFANPVIGSLPVSEIKQAHILKILEPIWLSKSETASRLRGRIEKVLDWAKVRGCRQGDNPAAWRGHLEVLLPAIPRSGRIKHQPALPYQQVAEFMSALSCREGFSARALQFAILTACRSGEVRGATWSEIDLAGKTWTIPASRMKAKKEHVVPLSADAVKILKALPRVEDSEFVFIAPRGGQLTDMALTALIRRMDSEKEGGWRDSAGNVATCHGMRSTFRDWAAEQTAFPREVIEHALAHQLKDKAEAAYQRGSLLDKRRKLMEAWATYCKTKPGKAKVTPIRGAA
ncbi:MAG: integrase arm-type DNA-binding domain-containing protein [Rhodocyclales bacterium]|nr:integrase arm-type DNA-binding domain-containing protein [Rhodocyclales bacterium]